jgi:hypothetical protein
LAGCSGRASGIVTHKVGGTVILDGEPVVDADVICVPLDGAPGAVASQAVTDENGRFDMSTYVGDGAYQAGLQEGRYGVTVTKLAESDRRDRPPANLLPKRYANQETSGLVIDVTGLEEHMVELSLTSR